MLGRVIHKVVIVPIAEKETVRVRWEYHFVKMLPETLLDQLVVASYSALRSRDVEPDWILYSKKDSHACRLHVTWNVQTKERAMRLEAVAIGSPQERLCGSLENILSRFRGLVVTRHAFIDKEESRRLEDVVAERVEESPGCRRVCSWLPPDLNWYDDILLERRRVGVMRPWTRPAEARTSAYFRQAKAVMAIIKFVTVVMDAFDEVVDMRFWDHTSVSIPRQLLIDRIGHGNAITRSQR